MKTLNHIAIALKEIGVSEISHPNEVLNYFNTDNKATPLLSWCSAFVGWVCKQAKLPYSDQLTARSWLNIGKPVVVPKLGDIVVLWRESKHSWKGHVGFFIAERNDKVYVLGGNQSDMVSIAPYQKQRVLGYRRLVN